MVDGIHQGVLTSISNIWTFGAFLGFVFVQHAISLQNSHQNELLPKRIFLQFLVNHVIFHCTMEITASLNVILENKSVNEYHNCIATLSSLQSKCTINQTSL